MSYLGLGDFVEAFAQAIERVDARRPRAISPVSKQAYREGIGPHPEAETVALVMEDLANSAPPHFRGYRLGVPYPRARRQRCDLCIGTEETWEWAIEVKMLRFLGDNGKPNDNILMHILSPYPVHRSALTDCAKLRNSGLAQRCAVLIYGFDSSEWPLEPALEAFETLARAQALIGDRHQAAFGNLVHPLHSRGLVSAWEVPHVC